MPCPDVQNYVLSDHAVIEMQRRGLTRDHVTMVLAAPEQSAEVRANRCVYQARLNFDDPPQEYLVRVFVDVRRIPPEVVTVYRTSKIQKYWR